MGDKKLT